MRESLLPFHTPSVGEEEIQAVTDVLRSGWLTTGPKVKEFEGAFGAYTGASQVVALNSGTAALHLALAAIDLKPGDEVILPTATFTASAEVVIYLGGVPILVDSRRDTLNLDDQMLEERITPRTRAIMPVHLAGQPCEMASILDVAGQYKLRVIEDAAHALPASYDGQMIGTIGDVTAFSFYATKTITTGEGGMATTGDQELSDRMRMLSLHGISKDAWKRYMAEGSWYYEVVATGFKYNMTDVAAALGIQQLKKASAFWQKRMEISGMYRKAFESFWALQLPTVQPNVQHAWHLYIILLNLETLTIDRSRFIEEMKERNIGSSVHFIPLHLHPFYRETFGYRKGDFPNAEWMYERCISLPIYPGMTDQDVSDVCGAVMEIAETYRR